MNLFLKHKKWLGYTLYGILLVPVFLYFLFPSGLVIDYIQTTVHERYPDIVVSIEKASLSFPWSIKLVSPEFSDRESNETWFKAKEIIVRPKILSLIGKKREFTITCQAYGGAIDCDISLNKDNKETPIVSTVELKGVHIDAVSALPASIKDWVEGTVTGTVEYSGRFDNNGKGKASLTLLDGSFKFKEPVLNILEAVDFREVVIKAEIKEKSIDLTSMEVTKGDNFLGKASGTITLTAPVKESRINIKCELDPTNYIKNSPASEGIKGLLKQLLKNGKLSFTLKGTVGKPNIKLT